MATLLFQNTIPAPPLNDPTYLAGITAIVTAITSGARLHVSLRYPEGGVESTFYADVDSVKVGLAPNSSGSVPNYVSGLLPLRPPIDGYAQVVQGSALVLGSVDSLGNYVYGVLGSAPSTYPGYTIAWWTDETEVIA
jgi:hypothetical protein